MDNDVERMGKIDAKSTSRSGSVSSSFQNNQDKDARLWKQNSATKADGHSLSSASINGRRGYRGESDDHESLNTMTAAADLQGQQPPQAQPAAVADNTLPEPNPWLGIGWERINKRLTLDLENKGSVARDHLANERTFLSWLRTSLAFTSIGVAVTQLFRLNNSENDPASGYKIRSLAKPIGVTFVGASLIMLFLGVDRYFLSQGIMTRGQFPASRGSIGIAFTVTAILALVTFILTLVYDPS